MRKRRKWEFIFMAVPLALSVSVFVVDLRLPLGWSVWLLYVAPVLLATWASRSRFVFLIAALCTAGVIVDFFWSAPGGSREMAIFNRSLGTLMIWMTAFITFHHRKAVIAIRQAQAELERRIVERQVYLERSNEMLQMERVEHMRTQAKLRQEATHAPSPMAPSQTPAAAPLEKVGSHRASILVIEDDPDTQALVKRHLEQDGYETQVAGDGIEALLCLGKRDFDLILSDITMPNMDGIQLLEMTKEKGIATPLIFLTAQFSGESEQRGLDLGAADFLTKPIKKDALLLRVKAALEKCQLEGTYRA